MIAVLHDAHGEKKVLLGLLAVCLVLGAHAQHAVSACVCECVCVYVCVSVYQCVRSGADGGGVELGRVKCGIERGMTIYMRMSRTMPITSLCCVLGVICQ